MGLSALFKCVLGSVKTVYRTVRNVFFKSRQNGTFWSKVGETGVGETGVGEMGIGKQGIAHCTD